MGHNALSTHSQRINEILDPVSFCEGKNESTTPATTIHAIYLPFMASLRIYNLAWFKQCPGSMLIQVSLEKRHVSSRIAFINCGETLLPFEESITTTTTITTTSAVQV
jgi:hypothetical protein